MAIRPLPRAAGLAFLLSLPFVPAAPLAAQESGDTPASERAASKGDERVRERVLHLVGGRTVRARSRFVDDHWEVQSGEDWHAYPAGYVERAAAVSDLKKEAKKRVRRIRPGYSDERMAHAEWLHTEGLVTECLTQLDKILTEVPEHPRALAILADPDVRIELPGLEVAPDQLEHAVRLLVSKARMYGHSGRELAVRRLGQLDPGSIDLRETLMQGLVAVSPKERAFCALGMRRLFPGEAVRTMLVRAVLDPEKEVRREAALALRAVEDASVTVPVVKALGSESSTVRTHAAETLGIMGYPAAVAPLVSALNTAAGIGAGGGISARGYLTVTEQLAYVQDFDVEIAQGASIADPIVNVQTSGVILDARVLGVQMYEIRTELATIHRSLGQLTGASPGKKVGDWNAWWAEHEGEYTTSHP